MRDKILRMELYGKFEDESLIKEVLASFPVRVENTLNYYRTKLLGKVPEDRDSTIRLPYCQLSKQLSVLDADWMPDERTKVVIVMKILCTLALHHSLPH